MIVWDFFWIFFIMFMMRYGCSIIMILWEFFILLMIKIDKRFCYVCFWIFYFINGFYVVFWFNIIFCY